ncbi:MAG: hypothetical protein V1776_01410 [Candidatus Diapherotrites archaeon]
MKTQMETINLMKIPMRKTKKEETLLDQLKEAFEDIKQGRVYNWEEINRH